MTSYGSTDVHIIQLQERQIILIGTAHVSQKSVDLVQQVIDRERPDCVCVELDEKRYQSLSQKAQWQSLDIKQIIKQKQLSTLMINLTLASYQKKLGDQLGVVPGSELLEATRSAERFAIPVALCDRDVRVTLRRAWKKTSFFKKGYLLASLLASLFDSTKLSEEKLSELKESDALSELLAEMGEALPEIKQVLIDERDTFLSEKIKAAAGQKIVAVVGAGHVAGLKKALLEDRSAQMEEINTIPSLSSAWKSLAWLVPALILGSIAYIGFAKGGQAAGANALYWLLANGIPASIGALIGLAHPATILAAFVAAPITSLTPVIGAGYVCAFVQAMMRPPVVREFETVMTDMATLGGWWRNNLLKVFLAFLLPAVGSMIGTWIGGYEIISNLV
ncbi:MAG: TraB/GumN family protein [Desulfurivibrionaceae bacterium]|nr:TraB/GumN family protein [Desulfurivibrionaceae bacterium]